MYSPSIIVDTLNKKLKDITLTTETEELIKVVKIIKPTDKKNPNRVDIVVHAHPKNMEIGTRHFTYKNASHEQLKENLEWLGVY